MATIIQAGHRGKAARHHRWARRERADLSERHSEWHLQGVSQRQAARVLDVPRSTLQAWRAYQEHLDGCPTAVACCHSPPGLACLHRLVLALHVVCVEIGAWGIRLVCLVLELTGLKRVVGASYGTQQQVNRRVEEAIVADRRDESTRLAQAMPPKGLTLTQDATCTGGLCLVGIEPVRNAMVLEQEAQARDHGPWQALMAPALEGRNWRVSQSTSDEAPGLLAYVAPHLGAPHSPDLCHVQQELRKAGSAPMAATVRAAARVGVQAEGALPHVQEPRRPTPGESDHAGLGRPAKAAVPLAQVAPDVEAARREHHRLAGQREQVAQSIRALGHAYHCVDVERGVRRHGKRIAGDIHEQRDAIRAIARQESLSETWLARIAKAERVGPKMQATLAFVSGYGRRQVQPPELASPQPFAMPAHLLPSDDLERVASARTVREGAPRRALAGRLRASRFAPDGV